MQKLELTSLKFQIYLYGTQIKLFKITLLNYPVQVKVTSPHFLPQLFQLFTIFPCNRVLSYYLYL